jgi:hypothetical protein
VVKIDPVKKEKRLEVEMKRQRDLQEQIYKMNIPVPLRDPNLKPVGGHHICNLCMTANVNANFMPVPYGRNGWCNICAKSFKNCPTCDKNVNRI